MGVVKYWLELSHSLGMWYEVNLKSGEQIAHWGQSQTSVNENKTQIQHVRDYEDAAARDAGNNTVFINDLDCMSHRASISLDNFQLSQ